MSRVCRASWRCRLVSPQHCDAASYEGTGVQLWHFEVLSVCWAGELVGSTCSVLPSFCRLATVLFDACKGGKHTQRKVNRTLPAVYEQQHRGQQCSSVMIAHHHSSTRTVQHYTVHTRQTIHPATRHITAQQDIVPRTTRNERDVRSITETNRYLTSTDDQHSTDGPTPITTSSTARLMRLCD